MNHLKTSVMQYISLLLIIGLSQVVYVSCSDTLSTNNQLQKLKYTGIDSSSNSTSKPTGRKITLQEAVNIALNNNYKLKLASNKLTLARKKIRSAKADFLPSINGGLRGRRTIGQQFVQTTVSFSNLTTNSLTGSINASLPVFQGFRNIINLRQKYINKKYREAVQQHTRKTVIFNVVSGFLQVILNKKFLKVAHQTLAASENQLRQVRGQVHVGARPAVDLYKQKSIVTSNRVKLTKKENALKFFPHCH